MRSMRQHATNGGDDDDDAVAIVYEARDDDDDDIAIVYEGTDVDAPAATMAVSTSTMAATSKSVASEPVASEPVASEAITTTAIMHANDDGETRCLTSMRHMRALRAGDTIEVRDGATVIGTATVKSRTKQSVMLHLPCAADPVAIDASAIAQMYADTTLKLYSQG